jgi:hypothetical protein
VDERARQRACRSRKKRVAGTVIQGDLSHTGLPPQVIDLHTVVRESVDTALEKSRATLIRRLTAWLKDSTQNPGQDFAVQATCHAPACSDKCLFLHG